jgi:hypothetical protein
VIYVLDTSVISALHRNYYRDRFPTLWRRFDDMTENGGFTSTREAFRELEDHGGAGFEWASNHSGLFVTPDGKEGAFVARIFTVPHFRSNMEKQKLLMGGKNADPFLIARASVMPGVVVTMEKLKPNAARIPNICGHFSVDCIDLQGFMEREGWEF